MIPNAPDFLPAHENRPTRRALTRSGASALSFGPLALAPPGPYALRGGIAWPRMVEDGGIEGYAVLVGRSEVSWELFVFEEAPFQTIDWLRSRTGAIEPSFLPVAPFLALAWHYYLARRYAYLLPECGWSDYAAEANRAACVMPKPLFLPLEKRDYEGRLGIRVAIKDVADLAYRPGGGIHVAMQRSAADPQGDLPVALEALGCALVALEWVKEGKG